MQMAEIRQTFKNGSWQFGKNIVLNTTTMSAGDCITIIARIGIMTKLFNRSRRKQISKIILNSDVISLETNRISNFMGLIIVRSCNDLS